MGPAVRVGLLPGDNAPSRLPLCARPSAACPRNGAARVRSSPLVFCRANASAEDASAAVLVFGEEQREGVCTQNSPTHPPHPPRPAGSPGAAAAAIRKGLVMPENDVGAALPPLGLSFRCRVEPGSTPEQTRPEMRGVPAWLRAWVGWHLVSQGAGWGTLGGVCSVAWWAVTLLAGGGEAGVRQGCWVPVRGCGVVGGGMWLLRARPRGPSIVVPQGGRGGGGLSPSSVTSKPLSCSSRAPSLAGNENRFLRAAGDHSGATSSPWHHAPAPAARSHHPACTRALPHPAPCPAHLASRGPRGWVAEPPR